LKIVTRSRRHLFAAAVLLWAAAPAYARHTPEAWAQKHYATADRLREALNGRPATDRSRREYQRVIDAYRRVYYGSPASAKADPSVVAVAELLVEMGRQFDDDKVLRSAIGQYEFLRREYPGSRYRFDALFTIGEIYKDDLDDPAKAHETFQEFVRRYPHNRLAAQAREELSEPVRQAAAKKPVTADGAKYDSPNDSNADSIGDSDSDARDKIEAKPGVKSSSKLARVTGIRHWSTPDYTRVAIDLEADVKFDSQRIDHPDRIFFDLRGTKLASTLVGKSFDVDDGFLKKIRVAQFKSDQARVVLEVDSLSQYDAFLLPNPSRLIVDIHGKTAAKTAAKPAAAQPADETVRGNGSAKIDPPIEHVQIAAKTDTKAATATTAKTAVKQEKTLANSAKPAPVVKNSDQSDNAADDSNDDDVAVDSAAKASTKDAVSKHTVAKNVIAKDTVKKIPGKPSPETHSDSSSAAETPPDTVSDLGDTPEPKSAKSKHNKKDTEDQTAHEARPTANGDRSLIRALGLKIGKIVIDPGHGGHDTGTIGPNGVREKDVVLDVSRRLGKMLQQRLGAEVVYTRSDDTFIPLETRTAIANRERADLFISVHANSSDDPDARGVETYYLNFTSSKDALEVAARENAVSQKSIYELQDLVKKIALKEKIEESREFASDVQTSLYSSLGSKNSSLRNRGVKKAPFIVLIGANMPSILAEISFVSNPVDAKKLQTQEHRQQIADSLYRGIARYVNGLSGVKVASRISREQPN
jgi:N-acetylmuramoyl-L-alanine amidase